MGEPEGEPPSLPSRFLVYVENCDASYRRALEAGATSLQEPARQPDGQWTALVVDPFGYQWIPVSRK
jgi:PhnB protein